MSEDDNQIPPGVGPARSYNILRRKSQPLWVVGLVIATPLLVILLIFLVRLLQQLH